MIRKPPGSDTAQARPNLRTVLHRGHFTIAFVAVALAGLSMALLAITALRVYADHNLQLIARSISYTVEAAVVFNDTLAMEEALTLIAPSEEVADAQVLSSEGKVIAQWTRPTDGLRSQLEVQVANYLLTEPVSSQIRHQNRVIGTVKVTGNGGGFLRFLTGGLVGIIGCLALSFISAQHMSRRMRRDIVRPLRELAVVAHSARVYRTFDQRVPEAAIAELNDLSSDFNSLLGELEKWQAHVEHENQALAHKASHDSLTGLPNRAFFEGRLSRAIRNAEAQNEQVVVLFLDSDHFKTLMIPTAMPQATPYLKV